MELLLQRMVSGRVCVMGALFVDGASECFTLERPMLYNDQENVPQETCVPEGTYVIKRLFSLHFNRMMPHLMDVPGRSEIEIHWGNTVTDIIGCIALGESRLSDVMIGQSRDAFEAFDKKLVNAIDNGETITIEIKNPGFVTP